MSTPSPTAVDASSAFRRASGRVRKQPETYTSSPFSSGKRKRSNEEAHDGDMHMPEDYVSDEDVSSADEEPDEEEIREQNKKARKPRSTAPKKPAKKKPKMNGTSLPTRSAIGGGKKKKASKKAKEANLVDAEEAGGIYAQVFARDDSLEDIAAAWLESFEARETQALADVMNFVLRVTGCESEVSDHDIEDPDGCTNRLTDLQDEYQTTQPTDYPLIAKGKAGIAFKQTLSDFLKVLVKSTAANGLLYSNSLLMDNIEIWFSTMSSAGNRAFRHTATVASLSVVTGLCEVAAERAKEAAASQLQAEAERKKANINKGRVKQIEQKVRDSAHAQEFIEVQLRDWFDTVFIHRYRDVDPVIRRDCASALGDWVMTYPDVFFDGQHLRYLGWVLSDSVAATRGEVIKQLIRLYKEENKIAGMKTFTERFRGRLVEIATADAETSVRASGIELLDLLRENGLLEPDDVDAVGRLVYDSDMRVRKAVASFFAENVNDLYNSKVDELGGLEGLEESLPEVGEGNFEAPRIEWLKFKSFAEMMVAYDTDDSLPSEVARNRDGGYTLHAGTSDSRYTLAADVLYNKIDEIKDWQGLSGYLLFDHSAGRANGIADDALSQLRHECVLTENEETLLLEVVSASVKHTIMDLAEKATSTKSKLTKKQKADITEEQEEAARHLATLIPNLLNKFGDVPSTAAAVLRMENVLNLPSLQELRQDSVTYGALLDDVRKQFMSHGTDQVLGPASEAILHAKSYGELDDLTEEKVASLWEDVVSNLAELLNPDTITVRGTSRTEELVALSNNLLRITRLSQVSNCIPSLEDSSVATTNEVTGADYQGAIDYIVALVQRALSTSGPAIDAEDAALEDEVVGRAAEAALRYLQWKLNYIIKTVSMGTTTDIPFAELEALATRRDQYVNNLQSVLEARKPGDSICITLTGYVLDLHYSAVVLRSIRLKPGMNHDWDALIMELEPSYLKSIMKVFSAAEKDFAKLSGRNLENAPTAEDDRDLDAEPMDEDPMSESESDDNEEEPTQTQASQQRKERKQQSIVFAEKRLCELTRSLIFAVHAGVVDDASTRTRLERNKAKLGPNFKEILNYLDIGKTKKNTKSKAKAKTKPLGNGVAAKAKKDPKSNAIVADEEIEDEIEDADGVNEDALRRRGLVVDDEREMDRDEEGDAVAGEAESVLGE